MRELRRLGVVEDEASVRVVHTAALDPETPIRVGRGTVIHHGCVLKGISPISIGRYCEIAQGVHLVSSNHATRFATTHIDLQRRLDGPDLPETKGPIEIGHNVWIGDNAIVLSGVTVGDGAVIGAGAVVTRDVEPFWIVAGSPARPVRRRFSEEVTEALESAAWWEWSEDEMRERRELFATDLTDAAGLEVLRRITPPGT